MRQVDVAIIGAGTAGLSARREVAKVTSNYVVIDPGPLGTTCARVGCMPSKVLIQVANDYARRFSLAEMGVLGGENLQVDPHQVMNHVRALRDRFVRGVFNGMESWKADHLISERAQFLDENTLQVGSEKIQTKATIVATGSTPLRPKNWEPFSSRLIDTDDLFESETLPKSMAVIGLGVIGSELGQALNRLGVHVIGITLNKAFGGLSDPVIQEEAFRLFEEEMELSLAGAELVEETPHGLVVRSGEKEWTVEKALLSLGRRPQLDGLGLDKLSLNKSEKGLPLFDPNTFRWDESSIYIAGDALGEHPILHEAADEGRIAGFNAVAENVQCFNRRTKLTVTFSDPNIAVVGSSWSELKASKKEFVTGQVSFKGQGRAIVMGKEKGRLHIYGCKKTGRVLGAELMAPHGEHLAHQLAWAIQQSLTVADLLRMPFYHPVLEEGLRTALRNLAAETDLPPSGVQLLRCQDPPVGG